MPLLPASTIALTGFMGAGKSTVGARLATRLGLPFADLDRVIEEAHGAIPDLFASIGEARFRDLEGEALTAQLADGPQVLATGGGTLLRATNRTRLAATRRVWLRAAWSTIAAHVHGASRASRPLWDADAAARYTDRQPLYAENADVIVDVDHRTPDAVVDAIVSALELDS